jgi:hypothetical protein
MENTHQQQLELISEMINSAKKEFSDDSFIYLLWGWSVCITALAEFALMQTNFTHHYIVWLSMPVVAIIQVFFLSSRKKKEKVKSHVDQVLGYVWMAVGISIAAVLFGQGSLQNNTYPVLIFLYGIGTFISGGIMKLKPMMIGASCCWVIGFAAFFLPFEYQLLLLSLSVIVSYIIPGHMLKNRFRKNV